jgi:hypothetical protein
MATRHRTLDARSAAAAKQAQPEQPEPQPEPRQAQQGAALAQTGKGGTLADASLYADYAGHGVEDVRKEEMLIPILRILQPLSPQCEEGNAKFIPDAKPGMIYNTATGQLFSRDGFDFIICYRDHNFIEYVPRDNGGGFVGIHDPSDEFIAQLRDAQGEFGKLKLDPENEASNEIIETYYFYGIASPRLDDEGNPVEDWDPIRAVIPYASTQIKKYRGMMTTINGIRLRIPGKPEVPFPIFAHVWQFGTQPERNKKGSFFGWRTALRGGSSMSARLAPSDPRFIDAAGFHKLLTSGAVSADFGKDDGPDGDDAAGDGSYVKDGKRYDTATGEEIPF